MARLHPAFLKLKKEYIFPIIEKKLEELKASFPQLEIINLSIGDVALPLVPAAKEALCRASQEMAEEHSIQGYPPSFGYPFLREKIAKIEYKDLDISPDEVFISDGINSDAANLQELFSVDAIVGIPDPTYPVFLDVNLMAGRKVHTLPCLLSNQFIPLPPENVRLDFVYLCTPNNPTAVAIPKPLLEKWISYAHQTGCILIMDAAYQAFINSKDIPSSIYALEGAKEVAIEMRSFSKSAGFTALRCAYTILPKVLQGMLNEKSTSLHSLWKTRMATKSNGVSYVTQRAAEAVLEKEGKNQCKLQVEHYQTETKRLFNHLKTLGYAVYGGQDAPYIWWQVPNGFSDWSFFDYLLKKTGILSVPGSGFGKEGEGFIRLSGFATRSTIDKAIEQLSHL